MKTSTNSKVSKIVNQFTRKSSLLYGTALSLSLVLGCGSETQENTEDPTSTSSGTTTVSTGGGTTATTTAVASVHNPANSKGQASVLKLAFGNIQDNLGLADLQSLAVGDKIVLTTAQVNIGAIKVKANKTEDDSEKSFEKKQRELAKKAMEEENEEIKKEKEFKKEFDKKLAESPEKSDEIKKEMAQKVGEMAKKKEQSWIKHGSKKKQKMMAILNGKVRMYLTCFLELLALNCRRFL